MNKNASQQVRIAHGDLSVSGSLRKMIEISNVHKILNLEFHEAEERFQEWCEEYASFVHLLAAEFIFALIVNDPEYVNRLNMPEQLKPLFLGAIDAAKQQFGPEIKEDVYLLLRL